MMSEIDAAAIHPFEGGAMDKVLIEPSDDVAIVRLNNGPTNAVNPELVDALSSALRTVSKEFNGVVLAGGEKFFCIGLSLPELLTLDRKEMTDFWYAFNRTTFDLYALPLPTVCAVAGHAPAVGTIWACGCDFRFAADGRVSMGLNEIRLGIPTPFLVDMMLRQIVSDGVANDLLFTGRMIAPEEAKQMQLLNGLFPKAEVEAHAVRKASEMAALSGAAYREIKSVRNGAICDLFEEQHKARHEAFLDAWFSEPTQKLLHAALKHF
jgi:enoyl-CoA hydratase/carnithine racemase